MHKIIARIKRELNDRGLIESNQAEVTNVLMDNVRPVDYVEEVSSITKPEEHERARERAGYPTAGVTVSVNLDEDRRFDRMSELTDKLDEAIDEYQRAGGYTDTWSIRWYRTKDEDKFVIMAWYVSEME